MKKAIDDGKVKFIEEMGNDRVLNSLLPTAIGDVTNGDKAIEFMEAAIHREKAAENFKLDYLWKALFTRITESGYTVLNYDRHHAVMLEHHQEKVVGYFLGHYMEMAKDWNVEDYVKGVKRFKELAKEETNDYLETHHALAKDEVMEQLL